MQCNSLKILTLLQIVLTFNLFVSEVSKVTGSENEVSTVWSLENPGYQTVPEVPKDRKFHVNTTVDVLSLLSQLTSGQFAIEFLSVGALGITVIGFIVVSGLAHRGIHIGPPTLVFFYLPIGLLLLTLFIPIFSLALPALVVAGHQGVYLRKRRKRDLAGPGQGWSQSGTRFIASGNNLNVMFPFGIWAPIVLPMVLGGHHRKIIPYDLNGPFKQLIMSLFRLAWSSKIRLPLLITVAFLALDVNLQVEINVFWAPPADRDGGEDNEDRERPRRRHNGIHHAEGIRRGVIFPAVAPLAQFEDFEDDDDNDSDDSDSSTFSLPSDIEVPSTTIGRYIFPQIGTVPFTLNGTSHEEQQSHPHENRNGADPTEQAQEDQLVGRRVD